MVSLPPKMLTRRGKHLPVTKPNGRRMSHPLRSSKVKRHTLTLTSRKLLVSKYLIIERYVHPTPTYQPNKSKFDGQSTNKTDYLSPGKTTRAPDYRPRNVYAPGHDDRDFVSTTRGEHTSKPLPKCPAVDWMPQAREHTRDGHMHLSNAPVVDH